MSLLLVVLRQLERFAVERHRRLLRPTLLRLAAGAEKKGERLRAVARVTPMTRERRAGLTEFRGLVLEKERALLVPLATALPRQQVVRDVADQHVREGELLL